MLRSFYASHDPSVSSVPQAFSLMMYKYLRVFLLLYTLEACLKGT